MPRVFAPITCEELKKKIEQDANKEFSDPCDWCNYKEMTPTVAKDLSKVSFSTENMYVNSYDKSNNLVGYHTLPNGMSYLGIVAGGDWEEPLFFIIYWDGKKLRGYIPDGGNTWNTTTKKAYGNDDQADLLNIKKRYPKLCKDVTIEAVECMDSLGLEFNENELLRDIQSRIVKSGTVVSKAKRKPKKSIYDRLKELTFYGPNNETGELFQDTCHLCYKMSDDSEKAEILFKWAKEQAEDSKQWALEEGVDYSNDTCTGVCF